MKRYAWIWFLVCGALIGCGGDDDGGPNRGYSSSADPVTIRYTQDPAQVNGDQVRWEMVFRKDGQLMLSIEGQEQTLSGADADAFKSDITAMFVAAAQDNVLGSEKRYPGEPGTSGDYQTRNDIVTITITSKPPLAPCGTIEAAIRADLARS